MPSAFLREAPFVRLVFPVILGISLYHFYPFWHFLFWIVIAFLAFLFCVSIYALPTVFKIRLKGLIGFLVNAVLFSFGYISSYTFYDSNHDNYVQECYAITVVKVIEQPTLKGRFYKASTIGVQQGNRRKQGRILLFFEISERQPQYGDLIRVNGKMQRIRGPANPFEFDYQQYMSNQNAEYQLFAYYRNWEIISSGNGNFVVEFSINLQTKLKRLFEKHFQAPQYQAILQALILGDKSGIDKNLKQTFSATGTMHVLAVSGLHVGIVLLFAKGLLGFFFRGRSKVFATIFGLIIIWSFALLTGFSPSVSRACFMFSVLAIGMEMKRTVNVYNSIAFAAFILLIINPISLFNVGFQFSFLAVIGIVALQKPIRGLIHTSSFFWSKILDLTAVSVAAQLATLPLGLYYFGQFPTLFMFSNLLVIPAVTMVVYGCIVFIVFSRIEFVANVLSTLIEAYLWFIVEVTAMIEKFSFALIDNVWLSSFDLIFMIAIVIGLGLLLTEIRKTGIYTALIAAVIMITNQSIHRYQNVKSVELIRFDLGKKSVTVLRSGREVITLTDAKVTQKDWDFHCKPYLRSCAVKDLGMPIGQSKKYTKTCVVNGNSYAFDYKTGWLSSDHIETTSLKKSKFKARYLK